MSSSNRYTPEFETFWRAYPKRLGGNSKIAAYRKWNATLKRSGVSSAQLIDAADRYRAFCDATDKTGTEFVKQAATFLGPNEHWRDSWDSGPRRPDPVAESRTALAAIEAGGGRGH